MGVRDLFGVSAVRGRNSALALCTMLLGLTAVGVPGATAQARRTTAPQTDSAPSDQAYLRLVREGVAEFRRENWSEARAFFERAHRLKPSARTLRGLGFVAYEMHNYVEAESLLAKALRNSKGSLTKVQRAQAQRVLSMVHSLIGRYELAITPPQAKLWLDGRPLHLGPGRLRLDVGRHQLLIRAAGYLDSEVRLDVRGGEEEVLAVQLRLDRSLQPTELEPNASRDWPAKPQTPRESEGSLWESPWFWAGIVALAAGGVALGWQLTSSEPEPPVPSSGVTLEFLTVGR